MNVNMGLHFTSTCIFSLKAITGTILCVFILNEAMSGVHFSQQHLFEPEL